MSQVLQYLRHYVRPSCVPCLPTNAPQPPSGDVWLHEIKHDGATLASLLSRASPGLRFNEHLDEKDGFAHASKMGLGHRVEAPRLVLSVRALAGLDQVEEPGSRLSQPCLPESSPDVSANVHHHRF
jgi:hypothetical protein